jgi:hypothetical protein
VVLQGFQVQHSSMAVLQQLAPPNLKQQVALLVVLQQLAAAIPSALAESKLELHLGF